MDAAVEVDRSSPAATSRSVHQALGGGFVTDVMMWRNRTVSILVAAGSTFFWILFNFAGYSVLSLAANTLLLLVSIIFFWAKSATLLNRPLPPIPNLEISNEAVEEASKVVRVWVNRVLGVARDIGVARDRRVFLQVIGTLWVVSYVGSLFSFYTLVYISIVLCLTVPVLYDKYKDHEKVALAHKSVIYHYHNALRRFGRQTTKEKKTQ